MKTKMMSALGLTLALLAGSAQAHFGLVIPNHAVVVDQKEAALNLNLAFCHPFEREGMTLVKPKAVDLFVGGEKTSVLNQLQPTTVFDHKAWRLPLTVKRPGVYQFVMEPQPYWEPAEDKFIVHYTKVIVPAFGEDEGWDEPVGVKTEIVPRVRPWANFAGNTFQGEVLVDGQPQANVDVEVEYFNEKGDLKAPFEGFTPQVVKTDANGVFTFTAPWAGWWGFAALTDSPTPIHHDGKDRDVELGAVLWTKFFDPIRVK